MKNIHENTSAKVKGKGGWIALAVCGLLLVVAVVEGVVIFSGRTKEPDELTPPSSTYYDGNKVAQGAIVNDSYSEDGQGEDESVDTGYFAVRMNDTKWDFDANTMKAEKVYVANSPDNVYDMYFKIVNPEDESVLYTSPILEVGGEALRDITLDAILEPGRYECIMEHHFLDPETNQEVDGLDMYLTINIKNVEAN